MKLVPGLEYSLPSPQELGPLAMEADCLSSCSLFIGLMMIFLEEVLFLWHSYRGGSDEKIPSKLEFSSKILLSSSLTEDIDVDFCFT